MPDQTALFKAPKPVPVVGRMTDRQRLAWDLIRSTPGGVTADEIGAHVHGHPEQEPRCEWCATAGREVATSSALKPIVVRRRGGKYEPRNAAHRAAVPSLQLTELPGESFEDIFRKDAAA